MPVKAARMPITAWAVRALPLYLRSSSAVLRRYQPRMNSTQKGMPIRIERVNPAPKMVN